MTKSSTPHRPRPVVLCILDGWGHRTEPTSDNAILHARTPHLDQLAKTCPIAYLQASELYVGLPDGQMGNSEVGHMNLGAGRVVMQDLPRIDTAIKTGELAKTPVLTSFIAKLKASGGTAHLLGLLSPGGVHAHQDHIAALAKIIEAAGVPVAIHAILDGRDTPPKSAAAYLEKFEQDLAQRKNIRLVTLCGRFYGMDRDNRWERVEKAYRAFAAGEGEEAVDWRDGLNIAYERGESDEFVTPTVLKSYAGMKTGDGLLMANFRADRAREILTALLDPKFNSFARPTTIDFSTACGMVEYSDHLNRFLNVLFEPERLDDTLGEVISKAGLKQLRIAETEKYAHVTFFFNGGRENEYPGEQRILVPSPKVATYDLQPEMAAPEVTDKLIKAIADDQIDLVVVNYANTDMVGHTGDFSAAVRAVEVIDQCIGRLAETVLAKGGALLLTADHGNAEMMEDPETGQAHTAHTLNPVPVMLVQNEQPGRNAPLRLRNGRLADVAPTILDLLHITQPKAMTGHSLLTVADEAPVAQD